MVDLDRASSKQHEKAINEKDLSMQHRSHFKGGIW